MSPERYVVEWFAREVKHRRQLAHDYIQLAKNHRKAAARCDGRDLMQIYALEHRRKVDEYVRAAREESQKVRIMLRYVRMIRADIEARGIGG